MKLTRYRPLLADFPTWTRTNEVPGAFNRLFDDLVTEPAAMAWSPAVDIVEKENELLLTAEIPGMKKEDVEVAVVDGALTLRGEKKETKEQKQKDYRLWERSYGAFERSFTLPRSVAPDRISADFADGVLTVHMPKVEQAVGKKIEIKTK